MLKRSFEKMTFFIRDFLISDKEKSPYRAFLGAAAVEKAGSANLDTAKNHLRLCSMSGGKGNMQRSGRIWRTELFSRLVFQ